MHLLAHTENGCFLKWLFVTDVESEYFFGPVHAKHVLHNWGALQLSLVSFYRYGFDSWDLVIFD